MARLDVHVPLRTVFTVVGGLALVAGVWHLRYFFGLLAFGLLIAVTLVPLLRLLDRHHVKHGLSVAIIAVLMAGTLFGMWELIVPPLVAQARSLPDVLNHAQAQLAAHPTRSHFMERAVAEARNFPKSGDARSVIKEGFSYGFAALEGITGLIIVLVLAIYLLLDGKRIFAWMLSYVPHEHRMKVGKTAEEVGQVVRAYVRGQAITSVAAGLYLYIALRILHVPAAIPLAVFAALMDILPVLGIIATGVPAALLALTVSPTAAIAIVVLLLVYHGIENYLLIPLVYGKQLRLSTLSVLLAFLAGGILAGAPGAILALPLVAAYPIIERNFLGKYLSDETVEEHARMDSKSDETAKDAIEDVAEDARPPELPH